MHTPIALGAGNPLNAMTAGFMIEVFGSLTIYVDGEELVPGARVGSLGRASFSAKLVGETQIGFGNFGNKELSVYAAFSRPNFNGSLGH